MAGLGNSLRIFLKITLGCSLESGWSAYEVELDGLSPANILHEFNQIQIEIQM